MSVKSAQTKTATYPELTQPWALSQNLRLNHSPAQVPRGRHIYLSIYLSTPLSIYLYICLSIHSSCQSLSEQSPVRSRKARQREAVGRLPSASVILETVAMTEAHKQKKKNKTKKLKVKHTKKRKKKKHVQMNRRQCMRSGSVIWPGMHTYFTDWHSARSMSLSPFFSSSASDHTQFFQEKRWISWNEPESSS